MRGKKPSTEEFKPWATSEASSATGQSSATRKKQLEAGTKHFDYSDAPQFSNLAKRFGLSGEVSRPALRALINDAVMSFFIDDVSRAQASEANLDQ